MIEFCEEDEKHFYHEISPYELYEICHKHIDEIKLLLESLIEWIKEDKKKNGSPGKIEWTNNL